MTRRLTCAAALLVSLLGCIGATGGRGNLLDSAIVSTSANDFAPAFRREPISGKVRFGHIGNGCREHLQFSCIELTVGPEIDAHPEILQKLEHRLSDPCLFVSGQPKSSSAVPGRWRDFADFFQCSKPRGDRSPRYVELQSVADPTQQQPKIVQIRSYRIPANAPN